MVDLLGKGENSIPINHSLEDRVTQGKVSYIISIKHDVTSRTIAISFVRSPEDSTVDRVLRIEAVEDFSEEVFEPHQEGDLESVIGVEEYKRGEGGEYVMVRDAREINLGTKQRAVIEWKTSAAKRE